MARPPAKPRPAGPYFKEGISAAEFPSFDGTPSAFDEWLETGDRFYQYGHNTQLIDNLSQVATRNFKGIAAAWWAGLSQENHDTHTEHWLTLRDYVRDSIMSARWTENEWLKLHALRFQQRGYKNEKPAEFMARKLLQWRKLVPVYSNASEEVHSFEVLELWRHMPTVWAAHVDVNLCPTAAELIKTVTDKEEQLLASSISNIARLVRTEMQRQGGPSQNTRWPLDTHVAEALDDELEAGGLVVDSKSTATKNHIKATGKYKFLLSSNQLNCMPPRPCRHCGSPLHYNHDCASWKQQNRPEIRNQPPSRANEVYQRSYIAMLENDDDDFDKHCAAFHALLDTDQTTETYVVEYKIKETNGETEAPVLLAADQTLSKELDDATWTSLLVNIVGLEDRSKHPAEDIYEPAHAWERPAGHAVRGVDAFKVYCHVNSLKEPAAIVVGDSGATPTLISASFLQIFTL